MKQVIGGIVIAVVASLVTLQFAGGNVDVDQLAAQLAENPVMAEKFAPQSISFEISEVLEEDSWLEGTNRQGEPRPGPASDTKALTDSANSVCFLTKVSFYGYNSPDDELTCAVNVDDFTGWWNQHAIQGDGTDASVRCEARCLSWPAAE